MILHIGARLSNACVQVVRQTSGQAVANKAWRVQDSSEIVASCCTEGLVSSFCTT